MVPPVNETPLADLDLASSQYGYKKDFRTALPQFIAVSVKNLFLVVYGMTLGFSTILIPAVQNPREGEVLHLDKTQISWISSVNFIVVPVGCALSGVVTTPLGRRLAMQVVNAPFLTAWLLFHFSSKTSHLYGALFLTGLAGGLLEAPVMTYVSEITQPHLRGALTATSSTCIYIGVFTQFLFGLLFYWRTVALVNIGFTILSVVALFFIPESPHWLVCRRRYDDAKKSLQWLRGWTGPRAVEEELRDIQALYKINKEEAEEQEETIAEKLALYLEGSFLRPFLLVSYVFFVSHFSGMASLQAYAVSIFHMLEAPLDKYYATLILGTLQILGSVTCVLLVHYTGKRPLTFFSTASAGLCCLIVAGYDGYNKTHEVMPTQRASTATWNNASHAGGGPEDISLNSYSWIPTSTLMVLAFVTHTGIRLLPWILIGEVFSARTRSGAAGLASAIGYIFNFLANKMYISMVDILSIWGTYGLYAFVCLSGTLVLYFILPETEGKKLHDIENHFAGVKRLTNEVHRSKKKAVTEVSKMRNLKGTKNPTFEGDNTDL